MKYFVKLYSEIESFQPAQLENLAKLGRDINEDVVTELLDLHFTEATSTMVRMEQFYQSNNLREVAFLAHQFKSNCGQLGLLRLQRALGDLENLICSNIAVPERVSELIDIIQDENEICLNYLMPYKKGT